MGIIQSVQDHISSCFQQSPPLQSSTNFLTIQKDQHYLQKQQWYKLRSNPLNFDPNKLLFMYHQYSYDQQILQSYWNKIRFGEGSYARDINDVILPKFKFMIRKLIFDYYRGIPFSKLRSYLVDAFKLNQQSSFKKEEYNQGLIETFKGKVADEFTFVPLFGAQTDNLLETLKVYYLTANGVKTLSRILWVIYKTKHIQYCPTIVHIGSILILFLQPWEIYSSLMYMIDDSVNLHLKNQDSLRWHFSLTHNQITRLSKSFFETISSNSKTFQNFMQHFHAYDIDQERLFKELVMDSFLKHLPFPFVFRIFCIFINEGVKIYFRIIYALFKYYKEHILKCQTVEKILAIIMEKSILLTREQINQIIKIGFRLSLPGPYRNLNAYQDAYNTNQNTIDIYYYPCLLGQSEFIKFNHLQTIWNYLPLIYKQDDPQLVFPSQKYGYSLSGLLQSLKQYYQQPVLLLIKDNHQHIFGCFFIQKLTGDIDLSLNSTSDTFVFTLQPEAACYRSTGENSLYCRIQENYLIFGSGKQGPALQIQKDLWKGYSNQSQTFDNKKLCGGTENSFKIEMLECFVLQ